MLYVALLLISFLSDHAVLIIILMITELSDFDKVIESLKRGKGRRNKSQRSEAETEMMIDSLIRKMDNAAEEDIAANREGKLAIFKLKMAAEVETQLSK